MAEVEEERPNHSSDSTLFGPTTSSESSQLEPALSVSRKRKRVDMSKHNPILDPLWDRGMTNYSTELAKTLLDKAIRMTGEDELRIKRWIDNKKKKVRGYSTQERTKPKQKVSKRKKSSFNCFLSDKLKGPDTTGNRKDRLHEVHNQWKQLDPEARLQYEEMARQAKFVTIEDLTEEEKKSQASALLKELERLTEKFQSCGVEMAVMLYNPHCTGVAHTGTPKGVQFLEKRGDELNFQFANDMSDGKSSSSSTITTKELTQQVRRVMNEKYAAASNKSSATHFPYSQYAAGKVRVDGLPDNVKISHLASLGKKSLQSILEVQDRITIEASTETPTSPSASPEQTGDEQTGDEQTEDVQTGDEDGEATTSSASPSAIEILSNLEKGYVIPVGDESKDGGGRKGKGKGKGKRKRGARAKAQESQSAGMLCDVEELLNKRRCKGKVQYLVKWQGYPMNESTWEPEGNIPLEMREMYDEHKTLLRS